MEEVASNSNNESFITIKEKVDKTSPLLRLSPNSNNLIGASKKTSNSFHFITIIFFLWLIKTKYNVIYSKSSHKQVCTNGVSFSLNEKKVI